MRRIVWPAAALLASAIGWTYLSPPLPYWTSLLILVPPILVSRSLR